MGRMPALPAPPPEPAPVLPKLRVRTKNDYAVPFLVDCGQRNAELLKRKWTPLKRVLRWADAFAVLPERDYDVVHAINSVPVFTRRPYVVTFEDYLPRVPEDRHVGWLERRLRRSLLGDRCVAAIAISQYALRQFRWQSRDFAEREALEAKMELLYPCIAPKRTKPKRMNAKLKLAFVGHDFMRKGGPALLRAHGRLRAQGLDVETTVVSTLRWSPKDYIGPPSADYVAGELGRLGQEGVVHHGGLSNEQTMKVVEDADFLVLPTLHDTFGYVSLEALACGTPVLASATCAQPEIVEDGVCGHLLELASDGHVGKWAWTYRSGEPGYLEAYEAAVESLAQAIVERLAAGWGNAQAYRSLSEGALEQVRAKFDPDVSRQRLEELYERCRERL